MPRRSFRRGSQGRRAGYLSMELVLTLPILFMVLMALFEFALLFMGRSMVIESCRAGVRHGTLAGATAESVEAEVRKVLSPSLQQGLKVEYVPASRSGEIVQLAVHVPMNSVAPDLLWGVGFGLQGRELIYEARMVKE
ncbi:MAG: pilus assembly protein [Planctomycetaceae bacterium]|nr:pilus assembly protein [Planctomycetaceae bacterium]